MGRPRLHDDTTREHLLAAAERLLDERGLDAVTVRAVADAAGTTTRAVYSVLGSRGGLVEALAARLFDVLAAAVDDVPPSDDPVADVAAAAVEAFRGTALAHPALYTLVFLGGVPAGPPAGAAFARLQALVARVEGERGLSVSAADAARAVHALTEGLATAELRGRLGPDAEARELWRRSVTALVEGFATALSA